MEISPRMMPRSLGSRSRNRLPQVATKRTLQLIHILSSDLMIYVENNLWQNGAKRLKLKNSKFVAFRHFKSSFRSHSERYIFISLLIGGTSVFFFHFVCSQFLAEFP